MSNLVTATARRCVIGSSARKAVLMLLSDAASDDGSGIYISKSNMAADLEMSKRTVQNAISDMIEMGVIEEVGKRPCRNGFTVEYAINLVTLRGLKSTRAADAPVQQMHPTRAADAPHGVQQMHPNHPRTIHEPKRESRAKPRQSQIPQDAVISEAMLKAARKRNLSEVEAHSQFDAFKANNIAKGRAYANWDMAFVTWLDSPYFKIRTGGKNERTNGAQAPQRADPALENILRIAGVGEAQGDLGG